MVDALAADGINRIDSRDAITWIVTLSLVGSGSVSICMMRRRVAKDGSLCHITIASVRRHKNSVTHFQDTGSRCHDCQHVSKSRSNRWSSRRITSSPMPISFMCLVIIDSYGLPPRYQLSLRLRNFPPSRPPVCTVVSYLLSSMESGNPS